MKLWGGRFAKETNKMVDEFNACIGFGSRLYEQDILGSIAHATMLGEQNIIPQEDAAKIVEGLKGILADAKAGKIQWSTEAEDIHMNVETILTERIGEAGKRLEDLVRDHGAVAGINAGGFEDEKGMGNGGTPIGIVISGGQLVFGSRSATTSVIGFDGNGKLIVGKMTAAAALEKGVQEAVSFGPVLVANGQPAPVAGTGGGLNPRTAIGQRADGAVLLLVIDGRQSHSLGASYKDCQTVMLDYGAVNAANLDGGSSTLMIYKGKAVNYCASLYGSREIPTSFLVR